MALLPASEYIKTFVKGKDYPVYMDTPALLTLASGYLLPGEVPKDAIRRLAKRASDILKRPDLEQAFFECIWNGWIAPSSPIWANFGAIRGLPISCFGSFVEDSIAGIFDTVSEIAMMSKLGGGTSGYFGAIRGRGSKIDNGTSKTNGSKPFLQIFDSVINHVSQGKTRRGAFAGYLPIDHLDINEFLNIRKPGDPVQQLLTGVSISDEFIESLFDGNQKSLTTWAKVIESRISSGIPYIFYEGNANKFAADVYKILQKKILHSNLCTEIMLPDNIDESFICCLLSLNLFNYDDWMTTEMCGLTVPQIAVYFLDAVTDDFIQKASSIPHMEKAVAFAENHRALGIGVLGWHSYLQSKNQPFCGIFATAMTNKIFSQIRNEVFEASTMMASEYSVAPICLAAGINRRHSTLLAIAPTVSNATIQGWPVSPSIEPLPGNYYIQKAAKGTFIRKNPFLEQKLVLYGMNINEVWDSIKIKAGSVQHLEFMTAEDKETFRTFEEINQFELVKQAAIRQQYLDQGQSLNLNIPPETNAKQISKLYLFAHKLGLKSLYYQRSKSILAGGLNIMDEEACVACSG